MSFRSKAGFAAAVVVLAVPASASAATKTVDMGLPTAQQKPFQKAFSDVNDFFPHGTTIHVGDSIKFVPTGFHSVDIPREGRVGARADPADRSADRRGQRRRRRGVLVQRPAAGRLQPAARSSGALWQEGHLHRRQARRVAACRWRTKPKPFSVKFLKTGTYTYYCDVHAGMKGTIKVVSKNGKVPSAREDKAALNTQVASTLKTAKRLAQHGVQGNNVDVGASGAGGVEYFGFFPANKSVKVGHDGDLPDVVEVVRGTHGDDGPR